MSELDPATPTSVSRAQRKLPTGSPPKVRRSVRIMTGLTLSSAVAVALASGYNVICIRDGCGGPLRLTPWGYGHINHSPGHVPVPKEIE